MTNDQDEPSPAGENDEWLQGAMTQHERGLVRYAQQFVADVERARDVVQETFMKLHANRDQFRLADARPAGQDEPDNSKLTSWLYKVWAFWGVSDEFCPYSPLPKTLLILLGVS